MVKNGKTLSFRVARLLRVAGTVCILASAVPGMTAHAAPAPSFRCELAQTPIEHLICADDALAARDMDMAAVFRTLREGLDQAKRQAALQDQRRWLRSLQVDCGISKEQPTQQQATTETQCLVRRYEERITALRQMLLVTDSPRADKVPGKAPAKSAVTGAVLDATIFPVAPYTETLLHVDRFGRYALTTKSPRGTALQLIDRMAGPREQAGVAGHEDGRIDAFLDEGTYKLALSGPAEGALHVGEEADLEVHGFTEMNGDTSQLLPELQIIKAELKDFEQRSYWLKVDKTRAVAIEAAGRSLADLRLWKDGTWLIDAKPDSAEIEPVHGQPLTVRRFAVRLQPGLYKLIAYGGPANPWAKGSDGNPFYIRSGIPSLTGDTEHHLNVSVFGIDRYLVPDETGYARLELGTLQQAQLTLGAFNEAGPFEVGDNNAEITTKSRLAVAEARDEAEGYHWSADGWLADDDANTAKPPRVITVEATPGEPYNLDLQHDEPNGAIRLVRGGGGDYWIASADAGATEDAIDATGILLDGDKIIASSALPVGRDTALRRRFNLLQATSFFIRVNDAGNYKLSGTGDAKAEFQVEPLIPPENYREPDWEASSSLWKLDQGYYTVTIRPRRDSKGILNLALDGADAPSGKGMNPSLQQTLRLSKVALEGKHFYQLRMNARPEIRSYMILRRLPVDLGTDMPLTLKPSETVEIPVTLPGKGKVTALSADGSNLPLSLDGSAAIPTQTITGGDHILKVGNSGKDIQRLVLRLEGEKPAQPTDVALPAADLATLPHFPVLAPGESNYVDLARHGEAVYGITVSAPGLYRLETTGLLDTAGTLRSRVMTDLGSATGNGVGRNFLLQQYLQTGTYQLAVHPQGNSAGDTGVTLASTPIEDLGTLSEDVPMRTTLLPGRSVSYRFDIPKAGRYHLETMGLKQHFTMRLEDADGWSILTPGGEASVTLDFRAGRYCLVLLPQTVEARAVTTLTAVTDPPSYPGHGPHALILGTPVNALWEEPKDDEPRTPDSWTFELPADADIEATLSPDMLGRLIDRQDGRQVALIQGANPWRGKLQAGEYRIEVMSEHPSNRLPYTLSLDSKQLLTGERRTLTVPASVPVSIGSDADVEIASFGKADVRARLYRADKLIASNDDRPDDWNFAISQLLQAGDYTLKVAGPAGSSTLVAMSELKEQTEPPLRLPQDAAFTDAKTHIYPLSAGEGNSVLVTAAQSKNSVDLAIEKSDAGGRTWETVATASGHNPHLAVLLAADKALYRLTAASTGHVASHVKVLAAIAAPAPVEETSLTGSGDGLTLTPAGDIAPDLGLAVVKLTQPGIFRMPQQAGLEVAAAPGEPLQESAGQIVIGQAGYLAFLAPLSASSLHAEWIDFAEASETAFDVLQRGAAIALPQAAESDKPLILWRAESQTGQPLLTIGNGGAGVDGAARQHSAIAAQGGWQKEENLLQVLPGEDSGMGITASLPVRLKRFAFMLSESALDHGQADIALDPSQAASLALADGLQRLTLTLPPATAAIILKDNQLVNLVWSGDNADVIRLDTRGDRLILAHVGEDRPHAEITAMPLASDAAHVRLQPGQSFKEVFATAGTVYLSADAGNLGVFGGVVTAISANGPSLQQGTRMTLTGPAQLAITHGAGLVFAHLDDPARPAADVVSTVTLNADKLPATVPLKGERMAIAVTGNAPVLIALGTTSGVIVSDSAPEAYPDGVKLSLYAPQGSARFTFEAAGTGALSGLAELRATPVEAIGEGLGPKRRLGPGEARAYRFTVPDHRLIGIGLKASADVATCQLLDVQGKSLGLGVTQMHALDAGDYILLAEVPPAAEPVDIEPALVGITMPDNGPPDAVKHQYLDLVGLKNTETER